MAATDEAEYNFDDEFESYLHKIFYVKHAGEYPKCDPSNIEYFGVLSLTDLQAPDRKLWYIYYCKQLEVDDTLDHIFKKYGKKNMCEIFRKPVLSGVAFRSKVKTHFDNLKWYVKGNLLEAPPKSHYNDQRMVKAITHIFKNDRKELYNYIIRTHTSYSRYLK